MIFKFAPRNSSRLLILFCLTTHNIIAQKPPINDSVYFQWPSIRVNAISESGTYVAYTRSNGWGKWSETIVQNTVNGDSIILKDLWESRFSSTERYLIYAKYGVGFFFHALKRNDSSFSFLGAKQPRSFTLNNVDWAAYILPDSNLVVQSVPGNVKHDYSKVLSFALSPNSNAIAISFVTNEYGGKKYGVKLLSLKTFAAKVIWEGDAMAQQLVFDPASKQLAFKTQEADAVSGFRFVIASNKLAQLWANKIPGLEERGLKMSISGRFEFSDDGEALLLDLQSAVPSFIRAKDALNVDIYNTQDTWLQSAQLKQPVGLPKWYLCAYDFETAKAVQICFDNEQSRSSASNWAPLRGRYFIVERRLFDASEIYWHPSGGITLYVVDRKDGSRRILIDKVRAPFQFYSVSPDNSFLVFYNAERLAYFSMDLKTGEIRNLTAGLENNWSSYIATDKSEMTKLGIDILGWMRDNSGILVNGTYDIWLLDPNNRRPPVNVTSGEGRKSGVILSRATGDNEYGWEQNILLKAFNINTKDVGFYQLKLQRNGKHRLELLSMGPYNYSKDYSDYRFYNSFELASNSKETHYVLHRENAQAYTNIFTTRDFRSFKRVTNYDFNNNYNWHTAELHKFSIEGKDSANAILYKPENFDSTKQYPVIIYFYEKSSHNLNAFTMPICGGVIDIPHFTGNGYLVLVTDIFYGRDHAGKGALKTTEAAAHYLSTKRWVKADKIGINGHSFGGLEANYIATHSKMFAAVITGAGITNMITEYGDVWLDFGTSKHALIEAGYYRLRTNPWEAPSEYVEASPIYSVGNVTAPILIFHNKLDGSVNFINSQTFFNLLRRAGKQAWLLQYDGENHVNLKPRNAIDLEHRFIDFFDHFLKDTPMPQWMKGENADKKGMTEHENLIK